MIRLGATLPPNEESPAEWAQAALRAGYRAAPCPVDETVDDTTVEAYVAAAAAADVVIAEVGAWSNPLSPDPAVRSQAIDYCRRRLDLAETPPTLSELFGAEAVTPVGTDGGSVSAGAV